MNGINPELVPDPNAPIWPGPRRRDPAFVACVRKLFGTDDRNVVNAVDAFLEKDPGGLDHHSLRLVAACAPLYEDKNHVAYLIGRLPVSKMRLAATTFDTEQVGSQFAKALSGLAPETSRKLVLDLVRDSVVRVLSDSPVDNLPESARALVREHLHRKLSGDREDWFEILNSPFLTPDIASKMLDRMATKIERMGMGADGRAPQRMPHRRMGPILMLLLTENRIALSEDDVHRAWQLMMRCEPGDALDKVDRVGALRDGLLLKTEGRVALDLIHDAYGSFRSHTEEAEARGALLAFPELPEEIAREIVRDGVGADLTSVNKGSHRLASVRYEHYRHHDQLLAPMSSDELDRAVASLPQMSLAAGAYEEVADRQTLDTLCLESSGLTDTNCQALLRNPNLHSYHVDTIIDRLSYSPMEATSHQLPKRVVALFSRTDLDDLRLSLATKQLLSLQQSPEQAQILVGFAMHSVNSGRAVLSEIDRYMTDNKPASYRKMILRRAAIDSASPTMHSLIANEALTTSDIELAAVLSRNGVLRKDVWEAIQPLIGSASRLHGVVLSSRYLSPQYDHSDVAALVASGEAPPDRAAQLPDELFYHLPRDEAQRATTRLIDAGTFTETFLEQQTRGRDTHRALTFATHPALDGRTGRFRPPAMARLDETTRAIDSGAEIAPETGLKTWNDLPNRDQAVLQRTHLHELIDGRTVAGLTLMMPRTVRELTELSRSMHNCLANYAPRVETGRSIVAYTNDGPETYAAMWDVIDFTSISEPPQVTLREVNSKFNGRSLPPGLEKGLSDITAQINKGRLQPIAPRGPEVADAPKRDDVERLDAEHPVIRPPRRTPVPPLVTDVAGDPHDRSSEAPSLLGGSGDASQQSDLTEEGALPIDTRPDTPAVRDDKSSAPQLDSGL